MSALWTSADIANATGGMASAPFEASGVAFDSREVGPRDLFVALKGAASDGHRFLADAFARGATGALVSEPVAWPHILVADTQAGLEALGRAARTRAGAATIVGVTGSVGKTSVKEALRTVFEAQGPTHASVKSYNNHTGVPLSLARMPAATRWGVFEMGMNHAGEIAALTAQVRPHVAVVTHVGVAHIEHFADADGIADAKAEIFGGLEPGGAAVVPFASAHRDRLVAAARAAGTRVMGFGGDGDVRAVAVEADAAGSRVVADVAGVRVAFALPRVGAHHVANALCVLAAVSAGGGDVRAAAATLETVDALPGRGRVLALAGGARLIDEAYNANPDSMAAALATLGAMPTAGRRIAVLGAMRELGLRSGEMHAALAPLVEKAGVRHAILVGPEMAPLARALGAVHVADAAAALDHARAALHAGDLLLVKGSNGVGLAALVTALAQDNA